MKKKTMAVRIIGTALAAVFVLSAMMAFSAIGASAASIAPQAQSDRTSCGISNTGNTIHTQSGYDWNYPWNWKAPYHPVV